MGPGVRGTPDGGLAMPMTTGILYLDIPVSLWGFTRSWGKEGRSRFRSYFVVFTHVDGDVNGITSGGFPSVCVSVCVDKSKTPWVGRALLLRDVNSNMCQRVCVGRAPWCRMSSSTEASRMPSGCCHGRRELRLIYSAVSEAWCGRNKRTEGQKRERGCI